MSCRLGRRRRRRSLQLTVLLCLFPSGHSTLLNTALEDANTMCADWAAQGECQRSAAYMKQECPRSCAEESESRNPDAGQCTPEVEAAQRVTDARSEGFQELQREHKKEVSTVLLQQKRLFEEQLEKLRSEFQEREALLRHLAGSAERRAAAAEEELARLRDGGALRALEARAATLKRDLEHSEAVGKALEGHLEQCRRLHREELEQCSRSRTEEVELCRRTHEEELVQCRKACEEEFDLQQARLQDEIEQLRANCSHAKANSAALQSSAAAEFSNGGLWSLPATGLEVLLLAIGGVTAWSCMRLLASWQFRIGF